jgi:alkanesulfonate monooxygenase SsuD/methylene tetrahydromethanopterin reductase-like flavin-dependent oxidoreductase (luciferase family)
MTVTLKVSVIIPHALRSSAKDIATFARHVEDLGLDGVFVGDHLAAGVPLLESTVVLTAAATATERIHVGFGVMVRALRHPAWAAKQVATLQQLSRGRVILGVGLGGSVHATAAWDAVGVPFSERGRRTDAALRVLRPLIAGEPVTLDNGAVLTLTPGAEPPPIWIGGSSSAARRRAVAHGDAWFPSMITAQDLAAGDNHRPTTLVAGGAVLLGDPVPTSALDRHLAGLIDGYGIPPETASRLPLSGTARQVAQHMAAFAEAGA